MEQPNNNPKQEESIFHETDLPFQGGYDKHIRNARIMLFIIAGMQLIPIFILGNQPQEVKWFVIGVSVVAAAIFAGLAFWTKSKPFAALLVATCVYVGFIILNAILTGPASIFQGIIFKAIIIVLLILGLRNAKEAEDFKKTFGQN